MQTQYRFHRALSVLFLLSVGTLPFIGGCKCPGSGTTTTGATGGTTALSGAGPLGATIRGKVGSLELSGGTTAKVTDNGEAIDWTYAPGKTGTVIDGATGQGTITAPDSTRKPRTILDTLKGSGTAIVIVTGTLTGPPPPISGRGNWYVQDPPGHQIGAGTWTIP